MRLYYFNASKAIAERKAIVVSEKRFETIQEKSIDGWADLWLCIEAENIVKAEDYVRRIWIH